MFIFLLLFLKLIHFFLSFLHFSSIFFFIFMKMPYLRRHQETAYSEIVHLSLDGRSAIYLESTIGFNQKSVLESNDKCRISQSFLYLQQFRSFPVKLSNQKTTRYETEKIIILRLNGNLDSYSRINIAVPVTIKNVCSY